MPLPSAKENIHYLLSAGHEIRRFEGHTLPVLNVAFGPEEESVLSTSIDGSLIRRDTETGEIIRRYLGHESWVLGLDVSLDGRHVISSAGDGTVILWNLDSGEELRRYTVHAGWVFDVAFHVQNLDDVERTSPAEIRVEPERRGNHEDC